METLEELINACIRENEIDFNISNLIQNASIKVIFDGEFPDTDNRETDYFNMDRNHSALINGKSYNLSELYLFTNGKKVPRIHNINLPALHTKCANSLFLFITLINQEEYYNADEQAYQHLDDLNFYLDFIESNISQNIKDEYLKFWREVSGNISNAIPLSSPLRAALTYKSQPIVFESLKKLNQKLYDKKWGKWTT